MSLTDSSTVMRRIIDEIWNAGRLDIADELIGIAYVNHGGLIPDLMAGPEVMKVSVAAYRAAFPNLFLGRRAS